MKITKRIALIATLAITGSALADDMHWTPLFGGDMTLENPSSWYNANLATLGALPLATDNLFINRYGLNDAGYDAGTGSAMLNSALTGDLMIIAWQNPITGETQSGHLTMGTGSSLTLNNLQTGNAPGSTVLLNLSGNASLVTGGLWLGLDATATTTVNMGGSSSLTVTAGLPGWSASSTVVMDLDSTFTVVGGDLAWANSRITALGAGDSILATDLGTGSTEYTVIPEPTTFSMIALLGGGMIFIKRKFRP